MSTTKAKDEEEKNSLPFCAIASASEQYLLDKRGRARVWNHNSFSCCCIILFFRFEFFFRSTLASFWVFISLEATSFIICLCILRFSFHPRTNAEKNRERKKIKWLDSKRSHTSQRERNVNFFRSEIKKYFTWQFFVIPESRVISHQAK